MGAGAAVAAARETPHRFRPVLLPLPPVRPSLPPRRQCRLLQPPLLSRSSLASVAALETADGDGPTVSNSNKHDSWKQHALPYHSLRTADLCAVVVLLVGWLCVSDVVVCAAGACTYCVYVLSADVVIFMSSIQHRDTLEGAFVAGVVVMASGVLFLSLARRYALPIHLPPLYRACLRRLRKDDNVRRLIGDRLFVGPQSAAAAQPLVLSSAALSSPSASLVSSTQPAPASASSASPSVSGFRIVNCLPPGPRWHRAPGVTDWYTPTHFSYTAHTLHLLCLCLSVRLLCLLNCLWLACCIVVNRGWERFWRPRRAQFIVSVSGECGSGVMLAQIDSKLNDQQRIAHLSVESIQSTAHTNSTQQRIVVENDSGEWSRDMEQSSKRP